MAITNVMSVTRGLAELKLLDRRINSAISDLDLVRVGAEKVQSPLLIQQRESFVKKARADYQSVKALIARRNAIKSAIVLSNATTKVIIALEEMTVAEAIERKGSIEYNKRLLSKCRSELQAGRRGLEEDKQHYQQRLDNFLSSQAQALGKSKTDSDWIQQATASYAELNNPIMMDPLDLVDVITKMAANIDNFESEVDFSLSESNARTMIEIPD